MHTHMEIEILPPFCLSGNNDEVGLLIIQVPAMYKPATFRPQQRNISIIFFMSHEFSFASKPRPPHEHVSSTKLDTSFNYQDVLL